MKLGVLISYHHAGPEALAQLRLLVDSLRRHVPGAYERLLIVDDCSPEAPEWTAYQAHLSQDPRAVVYRLGPPRKPYYHPGGKGGEPGTTSHGHAIGIMAGFHKLRELGCSHTWVLDADCVVLDGGWLAEAMRLFEHERVAVVTEYFGGQPRAGLDQLVDEHNEVAIDRTTGAETITPKARKNCREAVCMYGFPVLFCALVDLTVEERFGLFRNSGWVNSRWGARLFRQGYRAGYFPFFSGRHVFHLGYGFSRYNVGADRPFGNLVSSERYAGKHVGIYHAGYLQLNRTRAQVEQWFQFLSSAPLGQELTLPPAWFVDPAPVPMHGREETWLRPFEPGDFAALREIDADPEATRFLSWGPHGEAETRAFLEQAIADPRRWYALGKGDDGHLVGYGEIRPLPSETGCGKNPAGFVYVIHPAHKGRGYAVQLLASLINKAATDEHDGFYVTIDEGHTASRRVAEKTGRPWEVARTEGYVLKGEPRRRVVLRFRADVLPGLPPTDPEACRREREQCLFDDLGVWR